MCHRGRDARPWRRGARRRIALQVESRWEVEGRSWPYRSVFDHVLRRLATTPGRGSAVQALIAVSASAV
ncbi:DUF6183 family protein [Streptomyces sp. NPDC060002]|uniref:DUF6183 family protein n=1 Tax=Streptomyces sp. NPDC060002 TaxID=3347033 RepID=UPI0036A2211C